jgi:hypothetical protein
MTILVSGSALIAASEFLESAGALGHEGTGMLAGHLGSGGTRIDRFFAPDQRAGAYPTCWVEVTRAGKDELVLALGPGERWVARIHSHPGEAFHSSTDHANPGLTAEGALSIVVPYFGLGLRNGLEACALLVRHSGRWVESSVAELGIEIS